ncbi:hypothetical protein HWD97_22930 [Ochrobactrum sp. C6C9]|uniref:hypothetical protein n=1 Tax=Ochrobactrum sp. C6C9 TaxID=2736662 RepID=UPI0035304628|nr:hypothetical protein [Ochrobactrum sp. C6C9]
MNMQSDGFTDDDLARRDLVRKRSQVEGVEIAYETALSVCRDPKSTSQARSNAARTLLEIGGMLNRADRNDEKPSGKELHEMTGDELASYRRQLETKRRQIESLVRSKSADTAFD